MRLRVPSLVLPVLPLLLAAAPPADAGVRTLSLRHGPITVGGFETKLPKVRVRAPRVNGHVTAMDVRLEYANGRRVSIRQVMLHHVVFINHGRSPRARRGSCVGRHGEPFYGTGEERQRLVLPPGYGYRVRSGDRWRMQAMLMSHGLGARRVYVRYTLRVVTGRALRDVVPFWVRADGCENLHPSYTVPGGGPPGSVNRRAWTWTVPISGRIVAAGGHLHGGSRSLTLREPECGDRRLLGTDPLYAPPDDLVYRLRPILHEPGPVETRYFLSRTGIPVRRGQRLRVVGEYDAVHPRARVMAVLHVYVARGAPPRGACAPLPADRREVLRRKAGRTDPPFVRVPLNGLVGGRVAEVPELSGRVADRTGGGVVAVRRDAFVPARVSLRLGDRLTWRFEDRLGHNVLLANGPGVVGTGTLRRGQRASVRFRRPGRYQLFCYLHPLTMHQEVMVEPG